MSFANALSFRTLLYSIIGGMALLLVGASTGLVADASGRYADAKRIEASVAASKQLFKALMGLRLERGAGLSAGDEPVSADALAAIARSRSASEDGYAAGLALAVGLDLPRLAPLVARLRDAHEAVAALRPKLDAALRQPKSARDAAAIAPWANVTQAMLDAILAVSDEIEASLVFVDPVVDHYLVVKRAAWTTRLNVGLPGLLLQTAIAAGHGLSADQASDWRVYMARAATAWALVTEAASRADAPRALVDSVAKGQGNFVGPVYEGQKALVNSLLTTGKATMSLDDLRHVNTDYGNYVVDAVNAALDEMTTRATERASHASTILVLNVLLLAFVGALVSAGFLVIRSRVSNPIAALTNIVGRLAERDFSVEIPAPAGKDEIALMQRALRILKDRGRQHEEATAARLAEQEQAVARATTVNSLCRGFDASVGATLAASSDATASLMRVSEALTQAVTSSGTQAGHVAAAAEEAAASVNTVAVAAEELSASIAEITRQMNQATTISSDAITRVGEVTSTIARLADASQSVGQIVTLISDIAGRTNLLALNATIEAARAGDAGKGFAVVASEVKSLATQTALATQEINAQITEIQGMTDIAVAGVAAISSVIRDIGEVTTVVAEAVAQQGAATGEISRTVQQVASAARQISVSIDNVAQNTAETGNAASRVAGAVQVMSDQADTLKSNVAGFLGGLRAA